MRRHTPQLVIAACLLFASCGDKEPKPKSHGTPPMNDMGQVVDDMGNVVMEDAGTASDTTTINEFAAPTFAGLAQLPIRVEHLAAHPGGGWAILGTPSTGAMVNGEPLGGRFAVGVVDTSGGMLWAKSISPPDRDSELGSVAADGDGNVYVGLVSFSSTIDFGDDVTETGDPENLAQSGFVVKYDSSGVTQWATGFWADSGLANTFVAARGDRVVAAGTYTIWDPLSYRGPDGIVVGPEFKRSVTRTAFVIPLDAATGQGQWGKLYSSTSMGTTLSDVEVLEDGSIVTAGYFDGYDGGTVTDPDGNVLTEAPPGGYVARFGTDGSLSWFTVLGDRVQVATDGSGIAIAGTFGDSIDFGGGAQAGPGAFIATVEPTSGEMSGQVVLSGMSGVLGLAKNEAQVSALVAPPREPQMGGELDGISLPTDERYAISFDSGWRVSWLQTFPTDVVPNDIGATPGTVSIGGEFVGEHDFGAGTVAAEALEGFLLTY